MLVCHVIYITKTAKVAGYIHIYIPTYPNSLSTYLELRLIHDAHNYCQTIIHHV